MNGLMHHPDLSCLAFGACFAMLAAIFCRMAYEAGQIDGFDQGYNKGLNDSEAESDVSNQIFKELLNEQDPEV